MCRSGSRFFVTSISKGPGQRSGGPSPRLMLAGVQEREFLPDTMSGATRCRVGGRRSAKGRFWSEWTSRNWTRSRRQSNRLRKTVLGRLKLPRFWVRHARNAGMSSQRSCKGACDVSIKFKKLGSVSTEPAAVQSSLRVSDASLQAILAPPLDMISVALSQFDTPVGIVGPMVVAVALLVAAERIHRAVWVNHRYWFTTWRWGRIAVSLFVIGMVLKLAASV